jgi:hypothetical protein
MITQRCSGDGGGGAACSLCASTARGTGGSYGSFATRVNANAQDSAEPQTALLPRSLVRNSIFGFGLLVNDSQGLLGALVYVPKLANA